MKNNSVLILGAGGHAKVLIDTLRTQKNISVLGILDTNPKLIGTKVLDIPVLGSEEEILAQYSPDTVQLINGMGSVGLPIQRAALFNKFKKSGYQFLTVIHPTAYVGAGVILGEGTQLLAGSIVQVGTEIGANVIVNTRAAIDHDCHIGDHVHVAPGVTCCGSVIVEQISHIGCGAVLMQGIKIGEQSLIAAGAVVIRDVSKGSKVAGVPAGVIG
jgi:sugar O-acyltransferase (sialic acid O-acetyltransferase NeuD family)